MDAAFALFHEKGYHKVGMTDVIRRSGGSLATAYELFENKEGLLRAIIADRCTRNGLAIEEIVAARDEPEAAMREMGRHLIAVLLDSDAIGLIRIIVSESIRDPAIGHFFHDCAAKMAIRTLAGVFTNWNTRGELEVDDVEQAADTFLGLLLHSLQMNALCGLETAMTPAEIDRQVDHVVRMMMCRYGGKARLT